MLIALAAVLAASAAALPSAASAQQRPSTAQRFADAAMRAREAIAPLIPRIQRGLVEQDRACFRVLRPDAVPPLEALDEALVLLSMGTEAPWVVRSRPVLAQVVRDLDRIPTRDPALVAGREAWRTLERRVATAPLIDRPCQRLEAWARTGFAKEATPWVSADTYRRASTALDGELRRTLRRAERRLRRLGVPAADARRFTAAPVWDGMVPPPFD